MILSARDELEEEGHVRKTKIEETRTRWVPDTSQVLIHNMSVEGTWQYDSTSWKGYSYVNSNFGKFISFNRCTSMKRETQKLEEAYSIVLKARTSILIKEWASTDLSEFTRNPKFETWETNIKIMFGQSQRVDKKNPPKIIRCFIKHLQCLNNKSLPVGPFPSSGAWVGLSQRDQWASSGQCTKLLPANTNTDIASSL